MDYDIALASITIGISLLVLWRRSDLAILTLAVFMGMVLSTSISGLAFDILSGWTDIFSTESVEAALRVALLFLPLVILEFAHMRHSKLKALQRLPAAVVFGVLIVANIIFVSPDNFVEHVLERSNLASLSQSYFGWIVALGATMTMVEMALEHNFPHGSKPIKKTSAKKKKKSSA